MKNILQKLVSWFNALFSVSGFLTSIILGLAVFFMLAAIGSTGQVGLITVVSLMVFGWLFGLYAVIRNFRETTLNKMMDTQRKVVTERGGFDETLASLAELYNRLKKNLITALSPTFKRYPVLYLSVACLFLAVGFAWFNMYIPSVVLCVVGWLILIEELSTSNQE